MEEDMPKKRSPFQCSFCGKFEHDVEVLIAGPSVYVCNECIELMVDMIRDRIPEYCKEKPNAEASRYVIT